MTAGVTIQNSGNVLTPSFRVVVSKISDDEYLAEVPSISYCMASGTTVEEAMGNIQEVLSSMLEIMLEDGEPIPDDSNILEYSIKTQLPTLVTA